MKPVLHDESQLIAAGEFKAKCLQLVDDVHTGKKAVVITKRGVPMARLVPYEREKKQPFVSVIGRCGPIRVMDDMISALPEEDTIPIDPFLG